MERVWLHKNFYFLVRKCLDFREENLKNNSSPFFSNIVRARAFNLSRPLIDTIKPYNRDGTIYWFSNIFQYIGHVDLDIDLEIRFSQILILILILKSWNPKYWCWSWYWNKMKYWYQYWYWYRKKRQKYRKWVGWKRGKW